MAQSVSGGVYEGRIALCISLFLAVFVVYILLTAPLTPEFFFRSQKGSNKRGVWLRGTTQAAPETIQGESNFAGDEVLREREVVFSSSGDGRLNVLALVGIQTWFGSLGRRQAIRSTWLPSVKGGELEKMEKSLGLIVRFVMGTMEDAVKEEGIKKEMEEYGDILRVEVQDKYANLNKKTMAFFKKVYELFDAAYFVKMDDDVYLRPDRLSLFLTKTKAQRESDLDLTYIGCMEKSDVNNFTGTRWFEPDFGLLGSEYYLHANGPIYVLSAALVSNILSLPSGSLRMLANEDTMVGLWVLAMNATFINARTFCHGRCANDSIAIFGDDGRACNGICDRVEEVMASLHAKEKCSGLVSAHNRSDTKIQN